MFSRIAGARLAKPLRPALSSPDPTDRQTYWSMTVKLYYLTDSGEPAIADLSTADGAHRDVLGNMGLCGNGTGVHRVTDEDDSAIAADAAAAGCDYYADDAVSAQWWLDYVEGYNQTLADMAQARDMLADLDADAMAELGQSLDADPRWLDTDAVGAILAALHGSPNDYESERAEFEANFETMREFVDSLER